MGGVCGGQAGYFMGVDRRVVVGGTAWYRSIQNGCGEVWCSEIGRVIQRAFAAGIVKLASYISRAYSENILGSTAGWGSAVNRPSDVSAGT